LLSKFNYVVALVPLPGGQELLVDATEPLLPCGVLPERCLNRVGRLIPAEKDAEGRWVDLAPTQRHVRYQQVALVLDARAASRARCTKNTAATPLPTFARDWPLRAKKNTCRPVAAPRQLGSCPSWPSASRSRR
jgi:hypothetical protein